LISERPTPECPLFPKAAVQIGGNWMNLGSAFGHKRTSAKPQKYISLFSLPVFVDAVVSIVVQMENDMSKRRKASKGDSK
jgi:hypothetical protein